MEIAETIGEAIVQQEGHLLSLLVRETSIATVGLRILDVYLFVGNIQVATNHDWFLGIKCLEELVEVVFPSHAIVQALQFCLRVWGIDGNEIEVVVFQGDDSSLVVVLLYAHAIAHALWLVLGVDGCARVTFLLGIVPIALVAIKLKVELPCLHLGFLQAKEIGIETLERCLEVLAHASAQAIHVPRYKL